MYKTMVISAKPEQTHMNIPGEKAGTDNAAEILRAIAAARQAHADAVQNWDGEAAKAAQKAFARFGAELDRYEKMVERFAKQGGCDGG